MMVRRNIHRPTNRRYRVGGILLRFGQTFVTVQGPHGSRLAKLQLGQWSFGPKKTLITGLYYGSALAVTLPWLRGGGIAESGYF